MGYLVISVKVGGRVKIGDDIEIIFADYDMGRIDVGIQAPKNLAIIRVPTLAEKESSLGNQNQKRHFETK